jgi:peptidoglycan/xylan/chitin deacetylase (PgdA/CDA1 family)
MNRPTVCLSFDWDGVSVWMAGGATDARSLSRGEFGPRVGIPRLLELCERLGITATFFTPGHTADTFPETAATIAAAGHEIAAHGYAHEDFELPLVEVPITFITSDFAYFEFNGYGRPTLPAGLRNPRDVEQIWLDEFTYNAERDPTAFTMLMLHPETIGWGGRIAMLERVLLAMQEHGARFVTAEALAEEFRAANAAPAAAATA